MNLPVKKLLKALAGVLYQKLAGNEILKALSGVLYQNLHLKSACFYKALTVLRGIHKKPLPGYDSMRGKGVSKAPFKIYPFPVKRKYLLQIFYLLILL